MGPNAATGPHLLIITVQYGTVLQNIKAPLQCTLWKNENVHQNHLLLRPLCHLAD